MAASVVPTGVQPTSTPAVAAPAPATIATPALGPVAQPVASGASGSAVPQAAAVAVPQVSPTAPAAASAPAESSEGTTTGTGGVLAIAERSAGAPASSVRRSLPRVRRAVAPSLRAGFALRPVARAAPPLELSQAATRPASLVAALGPFAASAPLTGAGTLVTLMVLLGGALLIALMCADAVGVGPRHDYLRRQVTHHRWPPWR
ncbi:MAG TPA: hypothetical protein VH061_05240 [Solirubrobacteraceae bacterium]|jgi:hypothetical protein|nr:hypothetical protein [Solirubrobacteraceae bacterium]